MSVVARRVSGVFLLSLILILPYTLQFGADPDLWWHLTVGDSILQNGEILRFDHCSFTARKGEIVYHEWLGEFALAATFANFGWDGLVVLRNFIYLGIVSLLLLLYLRRSSQLFVSTLMALVVTMYLAMFINLRPHSLSYALTVLLLLLFDTYDRGQRRLLWFVPPLLLIWVNTHGGFLLGYTMLFVKVAVTLLSKRARSDNRGTELLALCGVSVLLLVVQPHGLSFFSYLVTELGARHEHINEWVPLSGAQYIHWGIFGLLPLILSLVRGGARRDPFLLAMLALTMVGSALHARFFILVVIFGSLVLIDTIIPFWERSRTNRGKLTLLFASRASSFALITTLALFGLLQCASKTRQVASIGLEQYLTPGYPHETVRYLQNEKLGPNIIQPFNWGGYFLYHLCPRYLVAADGRNLIAYDESFIEQYLVAFREGDLEMVKRVVSPERIDLFVTERRSVLENNLRQDQNWREIYSDELATVFAPQVTQ